MGSTRLGPAIAAIAAAVGAMLVGACGGPPGGREDPGGVGASVTGTQTITVFAAASLTESFTTLGEEFERQRPGTSVEFNFGPSSGLATQIVAGAPADVFAAASTTTMTQVVDAGRATDPTTFARNTLAIAVPPDNPGRVRGLADLASPDVSVALCQAAVPCGAVAAAALDDADVRVRPVTQERDVKAVLTKVELGEVDAGLVYVTDVKAAGDRVRGIGLPAGVEAGTDYPIATVGDNTPANGGAQAFTDFVRSPRAAEVLRAAGFETP